MRRLTPICLGLVALLLTASAVVGVGAGSQGGGGSTAAQREIRVVVDFDAKRQLIQGFGMSVRVWSDPHLSNAPATVVPARAQAEILRELGGRLGLTRVRPLIDPGVRLSPGGSFNFAGKLGRDLVAFVRQARTHGFTTFFPSPTTREQWMTDATPAEYADYALGIVRYWRSRGLEPRLFSPLNEPQIALPDSSPAWFHDMVIELGRRLREEGIRTKLVVPDDENPEDAYRRAEAVLRDPDARRYVGAVAFHIYRGGPREWTPLRELAARYRVPLWMTEYANLSYASWPAALEWARTMHGLLVDGGVGAIDYLFGFFGDAVEGGTLVTIRFESGRYRSHGFTPLYHLTGHWSRFVRPGFRRVDARPARSGTVSVSAFAGSRRAVIVAVNSGRTPAVLRLATTGRRITSRVLAVRTSATERWRQLPSVRMRQSTLEARLSPQSVTTFVLPTA